MVRGHGTMSGTHLFVQNFSFRLKYICYLYELSIFHKKFYNFNQSNLVLQFQFHLRTEEFSLAAITNCCKVIGNEMTIENKDIIFVNNM